MLCADEKYGHELPETLAPSRVTPPVPAIGPHMEDAVRGSHRSESRLRSVLRASMPMLPYDDGDLPESDEVEWQIADVLRKTRPKGIVTHG